MREARDKRQGTRIKEQGTRSSNQEARIENQLTSIRLHFSSCSLNLLSCVLSLFSLILVPCLLCLVSFSSFSQSVSASLDRDKILLGEQVTLELKAEGIAAQSVPLLTWFSLPDTINHVEVVKRSPIDTVIVNGTTSYIQNLTLTSFDSGDWKLPLLYTVVQHTDDNKKDTLRASELTIQVLPVDVSAMQQYHQMKDIIDVDVQPDYWLMAGIALAIIIASAITWFLLKRKKEKKPSLQPVAAQSLFETAISQLEKLQRDNPPAQPFYTKLDEICRTFIQNQLHIRAMQLTSDELMMQLNVYLQPEARTPFYQLLRLISAVKFAKYQPEELQKATDIETAKAAVQHIYFHLQRNLAQHAH